MTPNPWFQFSTPGVGMPGMYGQPQTGLMGEPGPSMPTMPPGSMPPISRMNPAAPTGWLKSVLPSGVGMAANQRPSLMQIMASQMAQGKMFDPMKALGNFPINSRYAQFLPQQSPQPAAGGPLSTAQVQRWQANHPGQVPAGMRGAGTAGAAPAGGMQAPVPGGGMDPTKLGNAASCCG